MASHRGPGRNRRQFLVRYKGFGPAYDEWKAEHDVSPQLIKEYDELCRLAFPGGAAISPVPRPARAKVCTSAASSQRDQSQKQDRDARAARRQK